MANLEIKQCILKNNDCYKQGRKITPKGIVVHSTGANNPKISRYVQPDDGILGDNKYNNDWNQSGVNKCVHAFIGKDRNGKVRIYQTLPWNYRSWGCGSGNKGSYNNNAIQFEICEDALTDANYFNEAFSLAIKLCVYLAKEFNIPIKNIVSHQEAYKLGYASNHGDCDHWLKMFSKDMDWFRDKVKAEINPKEKTKVTYTSHRIQTNSWGSEITGYNLENSMGYSGSFGKEIDKFTVKLSEGRITYTAHRDGKWGNEIHGFSKTDTKNYAGSSNKPIDAIAIKAEGINGKLKYRVHRTDGKWGNWITGYSKTDTNNYAGSFGKSIDAIQIGIE